MSDLYYMQDSRGYVGNAVSWWKQDREGYTLDPRRAHVFTREQAQRQHRSRKTDIPWPKDYIDGLATLQVDMQRLDHTCRVLVETP